MSLVIGNSGNVIGKLTKIFKSNEKSSKSEETYLNSQRVIVQITPSIFYKYELKFGSHINNTWIYSIDFS